ncbi:hypothetical protein Poli38472_011096 [Pythium oligandrum]|uniref:Phospholipid/glycerol acyltransferase domain-containing protein n=1 Tax=Pythium oligandrum TaxID=41045 RepID=A0A8K1CPL1_PYTOL|nr:hypothetical protein Poli38472_011096 [Pythium oligandrum]|eukprot:TMW67476.1 hypothetical protein Poli38472_011096 [Pythium oligandrum]
MKLYNREVLNDVWSQFLALSLLIALAVDSLNPIKAVSGFLGVPSYSWGFLFFAVMLGLLYNNLSTVIYSTMRVYLNSIISISFKSVDVVGLDKIPKDGPVIFTGNHANQFVDALVVMMTTPRNLGFLIAEKSWHRPVIGDLSRIMGCIPVVRPQDSVVPGVGKVRLEAAAAAALSQSSDDEGGKKEFKLVGEDTSFTAQLTPGDQVRLQGKTVKDSGAPVKVVKIVSDTELILDGAFKDAQGKPVFEASPFGIFKKVDQGVTFAKVYSHLNRGNCIGIFPEGGSHDRTDLLPLKAGVAIMAMGVRDKYNINVPVVPVGLNYFRGHRFRGRVTVEFGSPIYSDDQLMKVYENDKRKACNEFLHRVEEGMRSVIVTTPNYNIQQLVFTARRLFQRSGMRLSVKETQDLNRRFAEGYKLLSTLPEASQDLEQLHKKLDDYNKTLKLMGLKDHQVPFIAWWTIHDVIGSSVYGFLIFALASIPSFVLNAPVGILARYLALTEQKKALAGSTVKLAGRDVMLSKKILFSMVAVPVLWLVYFFLLVLFTDWYLSSIILLLLSFPLFSFFGVRSVEAGIIELKTVRPLFYRLLPQHRATQDELPARRAELQKDVRNFIRKYREQLGPLVEKEPMDWHAFMHERAIIDAETKKKQKEIEAEAKRVESEEAASAQSTPVSTDTESPAEDVAAPPVTITNDHDISFLKRSTRSMIDLAGHERSMTCPPGFQEVLAKEMQKEEERQRSLTASE